MQSHEVGAGPSSGRRAAGRGRRLLLVGLAGVLAWTGVSFMAGAGSTAPPVSVVPGASASGAVAEVRPLTDTVTSSTGHAFVQNGVKFARVDVAATYQDKLRVTMAWQNPTEFARNTGTTAWQIRLGLYYPVRTGTCTNADPGQAVSVTLSAGESYTSGTPQTFCAYRDTTATGPGVITAGDDRGTQLLASDWLLGVLRPHSVASGSAACASTGTGDACVPAGLGPDKRTFFLLGSLLNAGGKTPPGQVDSLLGIRLFVRATKIGA